MFLEIQPNLSTNTYLNVPTKNFSLSLNVKVYLLRLYHDTNIFICDPDVTFRLL